MMLDTHRLNADRRIVGVMYPPGRTGDVPYGICGAVTEVRYRDLGIVIVEDGTLLDQPAHSERGAGCGASDGSGGATAPRTRWQELVTHLRKLGGFAPLRMAGPCLPTPALQELLAANDPGLRKFVSWSLGVEQYRLALVLDPRQVPLEFAGQDPKCADRGAELARLADVWSRSVAQFLSEVTLKMHPGVTRRGATISDAEILVLEGTYLVAVAQRAAFHETLESLRPDLGATGIRLEVTTPAAPLDFSPTLDQVLLPARPVTSKALKY